MQASLTGQIQVFMGNVCFVLIEALCRGKTCSAGVLLQIASTQYPDDELSGEKYNNFFNERIAEVVFFPLQKPLASHINERHLLQTEASELYLSLYISHCAVNEGL